MKFVPIIAQVRPIATILLVAALVFSFGFYFRYATQLNIATDLSSLVPSAHQNQSLDRTVNNLNRFFQRQIVFLLSAPDAAAVADLEQTLTQQLQQIDALKPVDEPQIQASVSQFVERFRHRLLTEQQRRILLSDQSNQSIARAMLQEKYRLVATPQLLPFNVDPLAWHSQYLIDVLSLFDGGRELPDHYALVSVHLADSNLNIQGESDLAQSITQAMAFAQVSVPQSQIMHSGVFFYAASAAQHARADITRITLISGIAVIVLLLLIFRSVTALIFPMITVALGVGFALAVTHGVFGSVHILTIVFGASLIGIVIDYSIHYFCHGDGNNGDRSGLHKAMLLSLVTSMVGYGALAMSHLETLSQVALFSCAGMAMAWITVVVFGPGLNRRVRYHGAWIETMLTPVRHRLGTLSPAVIGVLCGGLVLSASAFFWLKPGSDSPLLLINQDAQLFNMEQRIARTVQRFEPGTFIIFHGPSPAQVVDSTEAFFDSVSHHPTLHSTDFVSITRAIPSTIQQKTNYMLQHRLYQPSGVVEHFYTQLGLPAASLSDQRSAYESSQKIWANPEQLMDALGAASPPLWQSGDWGNANVVLIRQGTDLSAVEAVMQGNSGGRFYSAVQESSTALKQQKHSAITVLLMAYGLVAAFLFWYYRAPSALVIVLIPLCGTSLALLALGAASVDVNLFHVMAAFLVLGLGLDYGIFIYQMRPSRFKAEQAVFICAGTSMLSFGLLAFSSVPVVHSFGVALLIANGVNLVGALLFSRQLSVVSHGVNMADKHHRIP